MRVEVLPPGRHITDERPQSSYRGWFYKMQTSALVSEDRFKVDYDLCENGFFNHDKEKSPIRLWDFDAQVLHDTLSTSRPTVVRLRPDKGGQFVGLCQLLQASNDFWIVTWNYDRQFDNRGLSLHGDRRGWLIANDAYALFDAHSNAITTYWGGRSTEKIKEVFNSEGQLCRIQYDQRIGREDWGWNFRINPTGETFPYHFCIERVRDFRTVEEYMTGNYRVAYYW